MRSSILLALLALCACGGRPLDGAVGDLDRCLDFNLCVENELATDTCEETVALLEASRRCALQHPCADDSCAVCWPNRGDTCVAARAQLAACEEGAADDVTVGQFHTMCDNIERDTGSNIIPGIEGAE